MVMIMVILLFASIILFVVGGEIAANTKYLGTGIALFQTGLIGIVIITTIAVMRSI